MSDMRWRDAIEKVLRESPEPVHYADITQTIIDNKYRINVGATPAATVAANLSQNPLKRRVTRVRPGVYSLIDPTGAPDADPVLVAQGREADAAVAVTADPVQEMGLINAFGMFWRRSEVDWSKRDPRLVGVQQSGSQQVDFGSQAGVYLLHDGNRVVYVGRVTEPRLGRRMWEHTRDRLTGRWDRFSWFGVRHVREEGTLGPMPTTGIGLSTLIATMEALLIEGLEPPQNRRQGDGFNALEYIQDRDPEVDNRRKRSLLSELADQIG